MSSISRFVVALIIIVLVGADAQAQTLTWTVTHESKLFINTIPLDDCVQSALALTSGPVWTPEEFAAFVAFCKGTSLGENPSSPKAINPLDARIRGGVDVTFTCSVGQTLPVAGSVTAFSSDAGYEGPFLGVANATTTRDDILTTGEFAYVVSGHPNTAVEVAFQVFQIRAKRDIWQHFASTISCGMDGNGMPSATSIMTLQSTRFPSHKVWSTAPGTPPAGAPVLDMTVPQGSFRALWSLPAIPSP